MTKGRQVLERICIITRQSRNMFFTALIQERAELAAQLHLVFPYQVFGSIRKLPAIDFDFSSL